MYYTLNIIFVLIATIFVLIGVFNILRDTTFSGNIYNKFKNYINNNFLFLVGFLFLLTLFTSIFKFGVVPYGIHVDEAGMAYDAFCLANYGVDRYLNSFPVYLINYGAGQSTMLAYLSAFFIRIFGLSIITVRLPAVLLRLLTFISIFFIMKSEKDKPQTLLFLFIFSICPYFIMQSRWGLDCNLLVGFLSIAVCLLVRAIDTKSNKLLVGSGLVFGLTLYTYALSYIIVPILLFLTCIYLLFIKQIKFRQIIFFGIPIFLFSIPLLLMIAINSGIIPEIKSFITIPKLPLYRGSEISLSHIPDNIYILNSMLSFDNRDMFVEQLDYNALPNFGTIYYFSIPFFIIGVIVSLIKLCHSIKERKFDANVIFMIWFISVLICAFLIYVPNINRINAIYVPIIYYVTLGIIYIIKNVKPLIIRYYYNLYY